MKRLLIILGILAAILLAAKFCAKKRPACRVITVKVDTKVVVTEPNGPTDTIAGIKPRKLGIKLGVTLSVSFTSPGEYTKLVIRSDGQGGTVTNFVGLMGSGNVGIQGRFNPIATSTTMVWCISNLHTGAYLDASGNVWFIGEGDNIPYITGTSVYIGNVDSAGNTVTGGFSMLATGWQAAEDPSAWYAGIRNSDSSLMICGDLLHGLRGVHGDAGVVSSKWVPIPIPGGRKVKSIMGSINLLVLCWDGTVWSLGNSATPQADLGWGTPGFAQSAGSYSSNYDQLNQVQTSSSTFLTHVRMIAGGEDLNWAKDSTGNIYTWTAYGWRVGHSNTIAADQLNYATLMNSKLVGVGLMPAVPDTITVNMATSYALVAGKVYAWGNTEQGTVGNGMQLDYTSTTPPYFNGGGNEDAGIGNLVQFTPVQIAPGISDFITIYNGVYYCYYMEARRADGTFISWGRNKGCAQSVRTKPADSTTGGIQASYPCAWQREWPVKEVNPCLALLVLPSTSPGCANSCRPGSLTGTPCTNYTPGCGTVHAVLTATVSGLKVNLSATTSTTTTTAGYLSVVRFFRQSGPGTVQMGVLDNPVDMTDTVSVSATGTHVFKLIVMEPNGGLDSTTLSVSVTGGVTQTGFYFSTVGMSTTCTAPGTSTSCPVTLFNAEWAAAVPGDTFYLNRGDVFPLDLLLGTSGSAGNPIVLTAYGTGPDPIIGGTLTLSGWTNPSGNLWQTAVIGPAPSLLIINGVLASRSTTPNQGAGYLIPTAMSINSVTDATNAGTLIHVGDTLIGRSSGFTWDRVVVTGIASGVISVSPSFTYSGAGGLGYLRMGDLPDNPGEWRDTNNIIQTYSIGSPAGYSIPRVGIPLTISGNYIKVSGIAVKGGDTAAIILSGDNCNLSGDTILYAMDGIQLSGAVSDTISGNYMAHFGNDGINKMNTSNYNLVITGNTVYDQGMLTGMGTTSNLTQNYCGIIAGDSGTIVKNNFVDSSGYIGIANYGSGFVTDSNYVNIFCWIKSDGAAIYTWMVSPSGAFARRREIKGDYASNGGGPMALNGTTLNNSALASMAYLDNYTQQTDVSNCTGVNINGPVFFDHGPSNSFNYCTAIGSGYADFLAAQVAGGPTITGLVVKHCIFGGTLTGAYTAMVTTPGTNLFTFGVIDSNYLYQRVGGSTPFFTKSSTDGGTSRSFGNWQSNTGYDVHSSFANATLYPQVNSSFALISQLLTGLYQDPQGNRYQWKTSVGPLSALVLLPAGNSYSEMLHQGRIHVLSH